MAFLFATSLAIAQTVELEHELLAVTELNLAVSQAEDIDAIAATIHPEAPGYHQTLDLMEKLSQTYDLRYRLLSFHFVALDAEFAYARVEQETRKYEGPKFMDNVTTALWVYRLDGGKWKLWSQALLKVDPFVPPIDDDDDLPGRVRLDFPAVGLIASWLETELIDCSQVTEIAPAPAATRFCLRPAGSLYPVIEDDLLLLAVGGSADIDDWMEVESGHMLEFTWRDVRYVLTHRSDGYSIIDAYQ